MEWLNYHHLYYFYITVRAGTISAAAEQLHLTRPTVAAQLKELEKAMGQPLFQKQGRGFELSQFGQQVFEYAQDIFAVGHELKEFVRTGQVGSRQRFTVGMPDVVPKLIAFELLKPALHLPERPRTLCLEGPLHQLLTDLALHKLDVVLSDAPAPSTLDFKVYSHKLGECGLSMLATSSLAQKYQTNFPYSLNQAPCLFPSDQTAVRRSLDLWLEEKDIFPDIVAEFVDSALLKVFGQSGEGVFPVPTAIEEMVIRQYGVELVGRIPDVRDRFFAISVEKRIENPATRAIMQQAKSALFDPSSGA